MTGVLGILNADTQAPKLVLVPILVQATVAPIVLDLLLNPIQMKRVIHNDLQLLFMLTPQV